MHDWQHHSLDDAQTQAALALLGLSPDNRSSVLPPLSSASSPTSQQPAVNTTVPKKRKRGPSSKQQRFSPPLADEDQPSSGSEAINCICGFTNDDGFSIACDDCSRWCHAICFDIVEGEVPDEWRCWVCEPRDVDGERAVKLQKARKREVEANVLANAQHIQHASRMSPGVEKRQRRASVLPIESSGNTKRKRRPSVIVHQQNHLEDEHVDIDEPWTQSYVPITEDIYPHPDTRDKLRRQAQHWRGITALSPSLSPLSSTTPIELSSNAFRSPHPATVQPLPSTSFSHPALSSNTNPSVRPPSYGMHTTQPIPSSKFITPFTSSIVPTSAYLSDPLNAYAHLGMPKPFVHLMGPPLDVALDARMTGDEGRFVRSGCRPNAALRPIVCTGSSKDSKVSKGDNDMLKFGIFALRDLKANEEVVLGWEWDDGSAIHCLPAVIENPHFFPPHQLQHLRNQMTSMLHAISSTFATCACGSKSKDCTLTRMASFVDTEFDIPPSPSPSTSSSSLPPPNLHPSSSADLHALARAHEKRREGKERERERLRESVDLGPLIGVERGFRTRERVPHSGGMNGVEMVSSPREYRSPNAHASSSSSQLGDTFTSRRRHTIDNDSPTANDLNTDGRSGSSNMSPARRKISLPVLTLSPATASPSPRKGFDRKGKSKETYVEEDEESGMDSPSTSTALQGSNKRRHILHVDSPTTSRTWHRPRSPVIPSEDEEEKMPPKMRKKWIHASSDALRDAAARSGVVPGSPSASIESLGSAIGAVDSSTDVDEDRMDVDGSSSSTTANTSHRPPLLPPTVLASKPSLTHHIMTTLPHPSSLQGDNILTPSADFANLFLSPLVDRSFELSPSSQSGPVTAAAGTVVPMDTVPQNPGLPDVGDVRNNDSFGASNAVSNHSSPLILSTPLSCLPPTPKTIPVSLTPVSAPFDHPNGDYHVNGDRPDVDAQQQHSLEPNEPDTSPVQAFTNDILPPSDPIPARTPSPPPPPKVKLSLKDFAMRKKKQREETLAKAVNSPTSVASPLGTEVTLSPQVSVIELPVVDDAAMDVEGGAVREGEGGGVNGHANGISETVPSDAQQEQSSMMLESSHMSHPRPATPTQANWITTSTDSMTMSSVKIESTDSVRGSVVLEDMKDSASSSIATTIPPLSTSTDPRRPDLAHEYHANHAPAAESRVKLTRRLSQEDGEILTTSPSPPPKHYFPLARSRTPPTQPRSFSHPGSSGPASPTPSASSSRPNQPLSYPSPRVYSDSGGPRPLPSGPRALRASQYGPPQTIHTPSREYAPTFTPRGPSADRGYGWERDRPYWSMRGRGRGSWDR